MCANKSFSIFLICNHCSSFVRLLLAETSQTYWVRVRRWVPLSPSCCREGTDAPRLHPFSITGRWFAAYTLSYDEVRSAILPSGLWSWKDAGLCHIPSASVGTQTRVIPAQSPPTNLLTGLSWTILCIPRMKLSGSWQMLSLFLTWGWFQLQILLVRISGSTSSREMVL